MLDLPWPAAPKRCALVALYSPGDCFDVSFTVAETRGPAERLILIDCNLSGVLSATVDFIRDILCGRIVVDVLRYRFLWFQPYHLAFFERHHVLREDPTLRRFAGVNRKDEAVSNE